MAIVGVCELCSLLANISWNFFRRGSYVERIIILVIHKHDKEKRFQYNSRIFPEQFQTV